MNQNLKNLRLQSPKSDGDPTCATRVKLHYKRAGIWDGWNRAKFYDLCKLSGFTAEEIGSMCALKPVEIKKMIKNDKFPPTVSIHLAVIMGVVVEAQSGHIGEPVMPLQLLKKS